MKNLVILGAVLMAAGVAQAAEISLDVDAANSSVAQYGSTLVGTINDPFAYDPLDPTATAPNQSYWGFPLSDGYHGDGGTSHTLSYTLADGAFNITASNSLVVVDLWGRYEAENPDMAAIQLRDDNIIVRLYNGNYSTTIGSPVYLGIPNSPAAYARAVFEVGTGVTFDRVQITSTDANFTLMETRVAAIQGSPAVVGEYPYTPVDGGIEISNGPRRFNRALYTSVDRPSRLVALAGDRPDFMLMELWGKGGLFKLANLKLGFSGETWLSEIEPVTARYERGVQKYRIGEGTDTVFLDAVRAQEFDGLLLRLSHSNATHSAPLVFALGGRGFGSTFETSETASGFNPSECEGTSLEFAGNVLTLSGNDNQPAIHAAVTTPVTYKAGDPNAVMTGPDALLAAPSAPTSVGVLSAAWPQGGELFFILTPDDPASADVQAFLADPASVFDQAVLDNHTIAQTIQIDTPDEYLNATLPAALLAYNASWHTDAFYHGAISWHNSYAGWRAVYGGTVAGWHDRVITEMNAFSDVQHADGRIPSLLNTDEIYNMGEVLVDQILYNWEWTGNLAPFQNGGFDFIAKHLAWGETHMKTPGGLYENFLNAWNTDYKWCSGGGGTIASTYYWRANKMMADIAVRLGEDPSVFQQRATEISSAMKSQLWSERAGVYGEYRDRFGNQLLHESPDLSSIYTPIDAGFADSFESYRMLRFALRRFEQLDGLPRDGRLMYSSEWLPNHYSTRGLYSGEMIHMNLALFRNGMSEAAEPFRRAIDGSFFAGPGPGSTGLSIKPDGTYAQSVDFSDSMSMYLRTVVEGLFGIQVDAPNERMILQPSFPLEWDHASIDSPAVSYEYTLDGRSETLSITKAPAQEPTIRLRARYASIESVTLNGAPAAYTVEPGIDHAWIVVNAPSNATSLVEVNYGIEELPVVETPTNGVPGGTVVITALSGQITDIRDSGQGLTNIVISAGAQQCSVQLPEQSGVYTFFAKVEHGDVSLWVPVEVDVQPAAGNEPASMAGLTAVLVELDGFRNQRLEDLHRNTYEPLVADFYFQVWGTGMRTVKPNGRSWWEGHGSDATASADTALLTAAGGQLVAENGIPFAVPAAGNDAVFTSLYDNFPDRVEIPVNLRGNKICFLVAASLPVSQSRMDNGTITVVLGDGTERELTLHNPVNIDDWLGSGGGTPYVQSGTVQALGTKAHAVVLEMDLGGDADIVSVALETRTTESMIGLLGMTVMTSGYNSWAQDHGLTGDAAAATNDIEPDGLNNLVEYALGGNPTNSDAASVLPLSELKNGEWFYYIHNERTDDTNLTYTVERTTNLVSGGWNTNGVELVGEAAFSNHWKIVTNRTDVGDGEFIRLKIEQE